MRNHFFGSFLFQWLGAVSYFVSISAMGATSTGKIEFAGMYTLHSYTWTDNDGFPHVSTNCLSTNPLTKGCSCPDGASASLVAGALNNDGGEDAPYYCYTITP